jgi:hypothetical protein
VQGQSKRWLKIVKRKQKSFIKFASARRFNCFGKNRNFKNRIAPDKGKDSKTLT